jgi:sugar lactone lactonase YvrE
MEIHFGKDVISCLAAKSHLSVPFFGDSEEELGEGLWIEECPLLLLVGFQHGEIFAWNVFESRYQRFNLNAQLTGTASVVKLDWIPGSTSHFLSAFSNGTVLVFDTMKQETVFSYSPASNLTEM